MLLTDVTHSNNESMTEACVISEALGQSFQCIGRLCCRGTDKWCVINAEGAKFLVFFSAPSALNTRQFLKQMFLALNLHLGSA